MIEKKELAATYCANLRNLISAKGCTQQEVADLLEVSQGRVSQWYKELPPLYMAVQIAELFNTTVSEMIGEVPANHYENSRYEFNHDVFHDDSPSISLDLKEIESMEYLHNKGIVKDDEYMDYATSKLKEIVKEIEHE